MSLLIVLIVIVILSRTDAKFPNDPKPCGYGDTNCISNILTFLLNQKSDGSKSLNFIRIDPLKISTINIKQGAESPVNIDLKFKDVELIGLSSAKVTGIKGFGKDLTQQHEVHILSPFVSLIGDYSISGKVLILPVQGIGKSNITMSTNSSVNLGLYFTGTPEVKPDGTYFKVKNMRLVTKPKRVHFNFGNLFNGDKALGDNINKFINENWKDIFHEVDGSISSAFSQVFGGVIDTVFQKYPYEKFFL